MNESTARMDGAIECNQNIGPPTRDVLERFLCLLVRKNNRSGCHMSRRILVILCLLAAITCVDAFPLQTPDGVLNIYGMAPTENGFVLDIFTNHEDGQKPPYHVNPKITTIPERGGHIYIKSVVIVDSDDRFIEFDSGMYYTSTTLSSRALYAFKFDKPTTQIKRIRVEMWDGNIYSIPWEGVPKVYNENITMQLYRVSDRSRSNTQVPEKRYDLEVKITNNKSQDLLISESDFQLLDQFGYIYLLTSEEYRLLPGESVRYVLQSDRMSPLSRPTSLVLGDLTMDLEGWY